MCCSMTTLIYTNSDSLPNFYLCAGHVKPCTNYRNETGQRRERERDRVRERERESARISFGHKGTTQSMTTSGQYNTHHQDIMTTLSFTSTKPQHYYIPTLGKTMLTILRQVNNKD